MSANDWSPASTPEPTTGLLRERSHVIISVVISVVISVILLIALAGPVLWSILTTTTYSSGDIALIEINVRDVWSGQPPLTGAYSRFGWAHPGPLMFLVFAVPYRLFGGDTNALQLSALLVNVAVIIVTMWLASRRSTAAVVWSAIVITGMVWGLQARSLADGWNVTITLLPIVLVVVACWSAVLGDAAALVVAAVASSFVFQSHVGFGVVIAPLVIGTAVFYGVSAWRSRDEQARRTAGIASGIALACLAVTVLPMVYDTLRHWPGNVGRLVSWTLRNDQPAAGLVDGFKVIGRASSFTFLHEPQPPTFFFTVQVDDLGTLPGLVIGLVVACLWVSWRRSWRDERALCIVMLVLWASGLVAAANIADPLEVWLIQWVRPLAWSSWATVALVVWRIVQAMHWPAPSANARGVQRPLVVAALAAFAFGTVWYASTTVDLEPELTARSAAVATLTDATTTAAEHGPVRIDVDGDRLEASIVMSGVVNELDRRGHSVCVDSSFDYQHTARHLCDESERLRVLLRGEHRALPPPSGAELLAIADALSAEQRQEVDSLTDDLTAMLIDNGLDAQIPLLGSPLVGLLIDGDQPAAIADRRADFERLLTLRQFGDERFGLYLMPNSDIDPGR